MWTRRGARHRGHLLFAAHCTSAEARHLAQVAAADFVHLHDSNAELITARYANGAMGGGPGDSAAPATASLAAAQQQKPKTVSRG